MLHMRHREAHLRAGDALRFFCLAGWSSGRRMSSRTRNQSVTGMFMASIGLVIVVSRSRDPHVSTVKTRNRPRENKAKKNSLRCPQFGADGQSKNKGTCNYRRGTVEPGVDDGSVPWVR